jgi:hypothetical protein
MNESQNTEYGRPKLSFKIFLKDILYKAVVSVIVTVVLVLITFFLTDFKKIVYDVPKKIDSIDSTLKITTGKMEKSNYREGFKPIQSGIIFNKESKYQIPNEQITIVKHKNNPIENIDRIKGKYILLRSSNRENPVWTKLLITKISENQKDIDQEVDVFVNDETAKLLTTNLGAGVFTLEYKLESDEQSR